MKVKEIINLIRTDCYISIREDNYFSLMTTRDRIPKGYLEREIIDIIPHYDNNDIENGCFVINIKGENK